MNEIMCSCCRRLFTPVLREQLRCSKACCIKTGGGEEYKLVKVELDRLFQLALTSGDHCKESVARWEGNG